MDVKNIKKQYLYERGPFPLRLLHGQMQVGRQGISLKYDYGQILRPKKMSMSRDYHYRRIGGLGGLDRVTNNNFAKRTLIFIKINPLSNKRTATLVVAAPTARRIRGLRCAACSRGRGMAR
jgi:hypothetical protein